MIRVTQSLLEEVFEHARVEAPNEACGWLAGSRDDGEGLKVARSFPVPNGSHTPEVRFVMEPGAQIAAMREIRDSDLDIVGTYHSHPKSPARPSERDGELALYPDLVHLIISLPEREARWWRITAAGVAEVEQSTLLL